MAEQYNAYKAYLGHRSRVKERFDNTGLKGFADHEILEMILFYAIKRADTKPAAKRLLHEFGSLEAVFAASTERLRRVRGVGHASARIIKLVWELGALGLRRKAYGDKPRISSASALVNYLGGVMANLPEEQFRVVFVDNSNAVLKDETLSKGIEDQTAVYPRKVMKRALSLHATGIIVAHNHPTGQLIPSTADKNITRALVNASEALDIRFLDHIILGREGKGYFSFRENGLI